MIGFLIRILGNSVALYAAYYFVSGFVIVGGIKEYLLAGILLGLLNRVVKPPFKLLTMPLIILTLGLFLMVINALMLWLVHLGKGGAREVALSSCHIFALFPHRQWRCEVKHQ